MCELRKLILHQAGLRVINTNHEWLDINISDVTKWPHQVVNKACPRFAMMQISVIEGLAPRYSEVSTCDCT
jgi:hypothetical protein